jgi:hypothetical protein
MIRDAGEEWPAGPLGLGDGSDTDWDYDFAVVLDDLEGIPISADGQVDLDTAPFDVMWFLLGRDISEDELAPTLNDTQREALQESQAEALWGD